MLEAMACGTPVIARPRGSVPEIVVPGRTGLLAETLAGFVDAIRRVDRIDRLVCRRHVERHFTVQRMAKEYEAIYQTQVTIAQAA
jgi:glycosyltransferase involved in cell wall biosynthesis